jgi:hypothetical protein
MKKNKKLQSNKNAPITLKEKSNAIASDERMAALIAEAEAELASIEPRIQELEGLVSELAELKTQKQKLLTFKLSLEAISNNYAEHNNNARTSIIDAKHTNLSNTSFSTTHANWTSKPPSFSLSHKINDERGSFDSSEATRQAKRVVRVSSLNYQLFQALVEHGGIIDTPSIKNFLLSQNVRQPGTGDSFEEVPLTSISSRMNYLVRKGLVEADGRGTFISQVGWQKQNK